MEIVLLSDPFNNHIIHYLTPVNLYNLCQTCKQYRLLLTKDKFERATITEIKRRYVNHHYTSQKSLNNGLFVMKKMKSIISGSFIIQCILGEYWSESSIDIYLGNITLSNKKDQYLIPNSRSAFCDHYKECLNIPTTGKQSIKYINLNTSDVNNFIDNIFDFNICKNKFWYDDEYHIYIKSINEILSKKATFSCKIKLASSIERYKKYTDRCFIFDMDLDYRKIADRLTDKEIYFYNIVKQSTCAYIDLNNFSAKPCFPTHKIIDGDANILEKYMGNFGAKRIDCCENKCIIKLCKSNDEHIHVKLTYKSNLEFIFLCEPYNEQIDDPTDLPFIVGDSEQFI